MHTPAHQQAALAYAPAPQQPQTQPQVPMPQAKPKGPAKSKTSREDVGAFIQDMIAMCAYVKELETQSHLIHLNYESSNFLAVHKFLKEQYETHLEQFDALAEFIRSMDYLLPMCGCGLKDALPEFNSVTSYDPKGMLGTYYKNLEELANKAKKLEGVAQKISAIDIANYMADLVGQCFKSSWFIKATLRGM